MKKAILLTTAFLSFLISNGQVETKYYPNGNSLEQFGINKSKFKASKVKIFSPFNVERMVEEDNKRKDVAAPFRFGKGFDTNISLNDGEWINFGGRKLWSMEFYSEKAYSLNFVFNDFYLSENAELYIANEDGTMLYGPVTNKNNPKNGFFLTDLIGGDRATIYLFEPIESKKESKLTITRVVHAYKKVLPTTSGTGFGTSLECNNDINCYPNWDIHSDAVGLILLSNGNEWCSGSLLMSTNQSFRPYFLTAFHCVDASENGVISSSEESNAENWLFKFQYKMASCNGNYANYGFTYNGAKLRAAWQNTDFALMEMDQSPVGNNQISWAGWDKRSNTPTSGTNIHHPNGDVMKISFDNDNLTSNSTVLQWIGGTTSAINTHWVAEIDNGAVQGGSSGSPIFNQSNRVVGQLHGGFPSCEPVMSYGKFNLAWTGGGTNDTRLSNWLDPCESGALTTNTARAPYLTGDVLVCSGGASFTLNNLPANSTIIWTSSSNITRSSSQGSNPCTFSANGSGSGWIKASITNPSMCSGATVVQKNVWVGKPNIYTLNPDGTKNYMGQSYFYPVLHSTGEISVFTDAPNTSFSWDVFPTDLTWGSHGGKITFYINTAGNYVITAKATNGCGEFNQFYTLRIGGSGIEPDFIISPNPASETLNITKKETNVKSRNYASKSQKSNNSTYELYNFNSNLIKTGVFSKKVTIDVSRYKKGIYILKIKHNEKSKTQLIIIE